MDSPETPNRPRWRKKRWWAAVAFWLVLPVVYILGDGPVGYCVTRGWISLSIWNGVYGPAWRPVVKLGGPPDTFVRYHFWWADRGRAERRAEVRGRLATETDPETRAALERELKAIDR
jgi:hypothetical protein